MLKENQFRLTGSQNQASMSSHHQIQEENKVIAHTMRTKLLITFNWKYLACCLSYPWRYSQSLNISPLFCKYPAVTQKLTLSSWFMGLLEDQLVKTEHLTARIRTLSRRHSQIFSILAGLFTYPSNSQL